MIIYKVSAYISVFIWFAIGILIISSISLSYIGMYINIIIGIIFGLISFYLFYKAKTTICIINEMNYLNSRSNYNSFKSLNKFIITEVIFNILSILVSIVFLSGMISRIWGEGQPVFG